jgi:putative ABC transport system ATP-binding protein
MTALVHTAREAGTAVLLITHDAQVAAYADREVQLRDGAVAPLEVTA